MTVGSPLKLVFANEAMGKILGYSIRDLMLLSPQEIMGLIYCEDREVFFKRMQNRMLGNPAESCYEFRAVKKDHSIIWLRAIANRIEFNGQLAVQGMFLDITEVKQTEEEVRNIAKLLLRILTPFCESLKMERFCMPMRLPCLSWETLKLRKANSHQTYCVNKR